MDILIIISVALFSGFVASAPIGPINLLVAEMVLDKKDLELRYFLAGVIVIDLVFAAVAFYGYHNLLMGSLLEKWLIAAGGIFILLLGILGLIRKETRISRAFRTEQPSYLGQFLKGILLCGTNPAFLLFWIFVASQLNLIMERNLLAWEIPILLLAIGAGTTLWFMVYLRLLKSGVERVNFGLLSKIRKGISLSLIILGVATLLLLVKDLPAVTFSSL